MRKHTAPVSNEVRLIGGKPTPLFAVAERLAAKDAKKAVAIHEQLQSFITRMAVNDNPEAPIEMAERAMDRLVTDTAAEIKEINNK